MSVEIQSLLGKASFAFVGTVLRLGAATMPDIDIGDHTTVVRIDVVLYAPVAFKRIRSLWITLQLRKDAGLPAVGQSFAFFANDTVIGESIAMDETARLPVADVQQYIDHGGDGADFPFSKIVQDREQDKIRMHMREADAVVVGIVVALEMVGPRTASEHDPDWWRATLKVSRVARKSDSIDVAVGPVAVLFANSMDVQWLTSPKCTASRAGVWILHRTAKDLQNVAPFQLVDALDFQTNEQLDLLA